MYSVPAHLTHLEHVFGISWRPDLVAIYGVPAHLSCLGPILKDISCRYLQCSSSLGIHWACPGLSWVFWDLLVSSWLSWAHLVSPGLPWVLLGSPGISWGSPGVPPGDDPVGSSLGVILSWLAFTKRQNVSFFLGCLLYSSRL